MKPAFIKRGRLEIVYEILSICRKPARKTSILYRCNLSYTQLQKYLGYLISHDLLSCFKEKRKDFYQVTDKGSKFLEDYERLNSFLEEAQTTPAIVRNGYRNGILHNHRKG